MISTDLDIGGFMIRAYFQQLNQHLKSNVQRRGLVTNLEILKLVQIELRRARSFAEHAANSFLLYLIDTAILEAERQAHYGHADGEELTRLRQYLESKSAGISLAGYGPPS